MSERGYQYGYSRLHPEVTDPVSRERKANTAISVLEQHLGENLQHQTVLDVGGSSGVMAAAIARRGCKVTAIDIDAEAIAKAKESTANDDVEFRIGDAMALDFADACVDIVLCCHVYEHVPDSQRMMHEIHRVLRPGGICYFAAGNRYAWMEPHYRLPLLAAIPRSLANIYLRALGRGDFYHEKHLSYFGLRRLAGDFELHDYTKKMIDDPVTYGIEYMVSPGSMKQRAASLVMSVAPWLCPSYIWLLNRR